MTNYQKAALVTAVVVGGALLNYVADDPVGVSRYVGGWPFRPTLPTTPLPPGEGEVDMNPDDDVLLSISALQRIGHFWVPGGYPDPAWEIAEGGVLGVSADGTKLFMSCHYNDGFLQLPLPFPLVSDATILPDVPCVSVPGDPHPDDTSGNLLGSLLVWNNRLIVSKYIYYDGNDNAPYSHQANTAADGSGSWLSVMNAHHPPVYAGYVGNQGHTAGYMGVIPPAWRSRFGDRCCMTGQGNLSRVGRTSSGVGLHAFNPDDVQSGTSVNTVPMVYYTLEDEMSEPHDSKFNFTMLLGGVIWPVGSRTVIILGSMGQGTNECYGNGTPVLEEAGTQCRIAGDPTNTETCCYDPTDGSKGNHDYPYASHAWLYDALDLAEVAAGTRAPWSVQPYWHGPVPGWSWDTLKVRRGGTIYDPVHKRAYATLDYGGNPHVFVFNVVVP